MSDRRRIVRLLSTLAAGAFAIWLPFRLSPGDLALYRLMGLYAIVAVGLSLLMGFAGQISLGQGSFYIIGAYTAGILAVGVDPADRLVDPHTGIDPLLALLCAPVVTGLVAAVIGIPLLRLRGHYLAFATLALHLITLALLFGFSHFTGGQDPGLVGIPALTVGDHSITGATHAAIVWGVVLVTLLIALNLVDSRAGRALRQIASSERSAAAAGVNVAGYKLRLFVLSAALAGLAGGLYAFFVQFLSPDAFPIFLSIEFVVMVAVGGLGSLYGAVAGAIAVVWLENRLRELGAQRELVGINLPINAAQAISVGVFAVILIVVILFFPRGLLPGLAEAARRLRGRLTGLRELLAQARANSPT